jgi:hypothetical protein
MNYTYKSKINLTLGQDAEIKDCFELKTFKKKEFLIKK